MLKSGPGCGGHDKSIAREPKVQTCWRESMTDANEEPVTEWDQGI